MSHPQPHNVQGLLRLAVENTRSADDGSEQPNFQQMTDERRQFLRETMSAMSGHGPVERMKAVISNISKYLADHPDLSNNDSADVEMLYEELEEVIEWCEYIDMACDFHKIGGFAILVPLQTSCNEGFKWRCGVLIATLCQNNPYCQQKLLEETDQLNILMQIVERSQESAIVEVKAIYALSCFLGNNQDIQEKFIEKDGYSLLLKAMQRDDNPKLIIKATFLIIKMMRESDLQKKNLTDIGCVQQFVMMMSQTHASHHEHIMAALLELVSDFPPAIQEATQPNLHMHTFLLDRIALLKDKPESEEELDYAKQLEKIIFPPLDHIPMDR